MTSPQSILVRGVNWLGDAVMTTPALQRLRQAHPAARLTLLTPEKLAGLWQGQPFLDEVISLSASETPWDVGGRLREKKFCAAIAFPNSLRSALELWRARIPLRIGAAGRGRSLFLTHAVPPRPGAVAMRKRSANEVRRLIAAGTSPPPVPPESHHVYHYLRLGAALGASTEPLAPFLEVSWEQTEEVRRKFGLTPENGPWIGLNPGAEYGPAKRWPAERFIETAQALERKMACRWVVFGGLADREIAEQIAGGLPRGPGREPLNLAGKTSLRELSAALKICALVLTNDTGPMHLAAAVGAPVVAIFGSTAPELTGPFFSPHARIVRQPVSCAPCFLRECPIDLRCLRGVSAESVIEAAMRDRP